MAAGDQKKAIAAKKAAAKGTNGLKKTKVYTSATFHRPKTLKLARKPTYASKAVNHYPRIDAYKTILGAITTDAATEMIESSNTLVLKVNIKANKAQIKEAVQKLYEVSVLKVNTLVRPDGTKKAFVRLPADTEALDVASRAGIV